MTSTTAVESASVDIDDTSPEPIGHATAQIEGKVASGEDLTRPSGYQKGYQGFQKGNQLWRKQRKPAGLQTSRRLLREAFHKALTPDKMAACVAKMLLIIKGDDNKAAVQAFKVLTECAGVRGDSDGSRSGPVFVFTLPPPEAIPQRKQADIVDAEPAVALPAR